MLPEDEERDCDKLVSAGNYTRGAGKGVSSDHAGYS
jgi:hypothetical protein